MNKRFLSIAVAAVLILPLISSCKGKSGSSEDSIVIWHWMTDREEAFQELARRYKEQTGNTVQFQLYAPSDVYSQKVRVGAQTNSLPDVYGVLGDARDLASFIEAGHVEDLTPIFGSGPGSWKSQFYDEALNSAAYQPNNQYNVPAGIYGVPIDVTTIPLIYNKKLFTKAGLDPNKPPATWAEFLEVGKKLKAAGVTGFVSGWAETWLIYALATDLAHNVMGEAKVMDTHRGKVSYTDSAWVEVFRAFEELRNADFVDPSLVTLGNKSAEQAFASERSAITFNGSWAVNVYAGMNSNLEYAPFRPPALGKKFPRTVWGGAGSILLVNAKSPGKQLAIDFLKWLSQKEQAAYLVTATNNLPAVKEVGGDIVPILKQFADLMQNSIHPNRFAVTEDPKVQEVMTKGIQSILIGEKNASQVAQAIQKAKEKSAKQ